MRERPIIITGPVNGKKTSMLYSLCSLLDSEGYSFGGMIQVPALPGKEKRDWIWSDQGTGEIRLLMSVDERKGWQRFGRFWIDTSTFDWARQRILGKLDACDYLTFDEIGPLELEGRALDGTFRTVLESFGGTVIAVVREQLLDRMLQTYELDEDEVRIIRSDRPWDDQLENLIP
ncbi:MAG: nucleoside-triphosphatase [Sphaerochaetaceae bacterium]|jgi:nucleoside-triphosphatase THEP1|nr:nucleoside-triphosphatase [Sphaerochaetaceae bacterium]